MIKNNKQGIGKLSISLWNIPVILAILLLLIVLFLNPEYLGFVSFKQNFNYVDNVALLVNESYEYPWAIGNKGSLTSVKLDGSSSKDFIGKVYLERNEDNYLILDSSRLSEQGIGSVTGLAVVNSSNPAPVDEPSEENSEISLEIIGGGRKAIDNVFEFNISSNFNWNVDYSKVCTMWNINSYPLCYGSNDCCAFINLDSSGEWNDSLYMTYKRYNSGMFNNIKVQLIYANYSINISSPYSEIRYSNIASVDADFYEERIKFSNLCIDSCLLPGLNDSSYKLRIEVEEGNIDINNIMYTIEKEIDTARTPPVLLKDLPNITISMDGAYRLNLSSYFEGSDDELNYSVYSVENITVEINGTIAILYPDQGFTGKRYMFFKASDGYYETIGNIFSINVVKGLPKPSVIINKDVKWIKKVNTRGAANYSINISAYALNVSVKNLKEDKAIDESKIKVKEKNIVKDAAKFGEDKKKDREGKKKDREGKKKDKENKTDYDEDIEVVIEEAVDSIEVEYYTEGPSSSEEDISKGKRIFISSDVHYTDILAYTVIDDVKQDKIKLYWIVNNTRQLVNEVTYYDENNNSLIDKIEWIVPTLSNQTYEVIIEITNAEHLDQNRTFIQDIYNYVKTQDNNWSPIINNGEYVRVTFETPLDSTKDITIYARDARIIDDSIEINGTQVPIDVYQKKMRIDEIQGILENEYGGTQVPIDVYPNKKGIEGIRRLLENE